MLCLNIGCNTNHHPSRAVFCHTCGGRLASDDDANIEIDDLFAKYQDKSEENGDIAAQLQTLLENLPDSDIYTENGSSSALIDNYSETIGSTTIQMIRIPGGTFLMGSSDPCSNPSLLPQHKVEISGYYMSACQITQEQYYAVIGESPSQFRNPLKPVENVSYFDAWEFCERLNKITGQTYRLPSESEWEYACRAESDTLYNCGNTIDIKQAWFSPKEKETRKTKEVGIFPPNAFGLHDMHGNVWEWCLDKWHPDYVGAPSNGAAWIDSNDHRMIIRGGAFNTKAKLLCSHYRERVEPNKQLPNIGFRIVCSVAG
jgi:eukaryotic-like serine/threonine-protein kinase